MRLVSIVQNYATLILVTLILVFIMVAAVIFYLLKIRKIATEEEHIDYSKFERRDATEYSKFDDIVSSSAGDEKNAPGMITIGGNTFIGGIEVTGYNYHAASADERERTIVNMVAFFNIVDDSIQLRQTVKAINIERNIEEEKECARRIEKELIMLGNEYRTAADALGENVENEDVYASIEKRLQKLMRTIRSKQWQLKEAKEMVYYMEQVSNAKVNMQKINQIMFTYTYNPDEDIERLSEEEVYLKAEKELIAKGQIYGGALENCGCSWRQLSADDLTELMRRHYHPDTADDLRLEEIMNSSYTALYVSSDSLAEVERERLGDLEYERQRKRLEEEQKKMIAEAARKREEERRRMEAEAAAVGGVAV